MTTRPRQTEAFSYRETGFRLESQRVPESVARMYEKDFDDARGIMEAIERAQLALPIIGAEKGGAE